MRVSSARQHGPKFVRIGKEKLQMALVPPAVTWERPACSPGEGDGLIPRYQRREEPHWSGHAGWHDWLEFLPTSPGSGRGGAEPARHVQALRDGKAAWSGAEG